MPKGARPLFELPGGVAGQWRCEGGEELTLATVDGKPVLHVASGDYAIENHWQATDGHHFATTREGFSAGAVLGRPVWQAQATPVELGREYVIPVDPRGYAVVNYYEPFGAHEQTGRPEEVGFEAGSPLPRMRTYEGLAPASDGSQRPTGDPWWRDVCWPKTDGVTSARAAQYLGAAPIPSVPAEARPMQIYGCRTGGYDVKEIDIDNPLPFTVRFAPGAGWGSGRLYLTMGTHSYEVPELATPVATVSGRPCLMQFHEKTACMWGDVATQDGYRVFYFERVDTGFMIHYSPDKDLGGITVYSPGDLPPGPLPPAKQAPAFPLSSKPKMNAFRCLVKKGAP